MRGTTVRTAGLCLLALVAGVALAGCMDDSGQETTDPGTDDGAMGEESPSDDGSGDDGDGDAGSEEDGDTVSLTLDTPDAWPTHGLNPQNTAADGPAGDGDGELVWSFTSPYGYQARPLAVALDHVYRSSGDLKALDVSNGEETWSAQFDGGGLTDPVVQDGLVLVGHMGSGDGGLYAFDATDGEEAWSLELDEPVSDLALSEDLAILQKGQVATTGTVEAIDLETQASVWQFDPGSGVWSPFTVTGDHVLFTDGQGQVFALELASGEEAWSAEIGQAPSEAGASVNEGTAFAAVGNNVVALELSSGEEVWTYETEHQIGGSTPAVADGRVFVGDGIDAQDDGNVYALDAETGEEAWVFEADGRWVHGSPAVTGERVYVPLTPSGNEAQLHALDVDTGETVWMVEGEGRGATIGPPSVVDGYVFVALDGYRAYEG